MSLTDRKLRALSYGEAASLYETSRPTYPDAMVKDAVNRFRGPNLIEVGAGTGKATRLFAAQGMNVQCVEADPEMAKLLRETCGDYPNVSVDVALFETWVTDRPRDGLFCAQAWHWLDPDLRWKKASEVIPGGVIALFWNVESWDGSPAPEVLDPVFARHGLEARDDGGLDEEAWPDVEFLRQHGFHDLELMTYDWAQTWSAEEFADYRRTTSQLRILSSEQQDALAKDMAQAINAELGGALRLPWRTYLFTAHRS